MGHPSANARATLNFSINSSLRSSSLETLDILIPECIVRPRLLRLGLF